MPIILAIETSSENASVALWRDGDLASRSASGVATHSQLILPLLQALLAEAGLRVGDCDAIAYGAGPGSFTGVRTACGIAQGLGFGAGRPVIPVDTLAAMALACHQHTAAQSVLALLDARMGEVYWGQYAFLPMIQVQTAPTLSSPPTVGGHDSQAACGNALLAYADSLPTSATVRSLHPAVMPHAGQIAALAVQAFERGEAIDPRQARPIYLRNQVALTTAQRRDQAIKAAA
ncbi:MAG: tRNA (adenosine(37)-N6)-threonylcarbamoyltransferase complex dimerization subunit type 1 TsaB [Pseudomonadota bacterium]|nr:tRNA (adenosine(37)-N6)-threonylcarbamoyltransferase complex dimerization subunit type 1 TsaB [Pseudomonadota bacterium]